MWGGGHNLEWGGGARVGGVWGGLRACGVCMSMCTCMHVHEHGFGDLHHTSPTHLAHLACIQPGFHSRIVQTYALPLPPHLPCQPASAPPFTPALQACLCPLPHLRHQLASAPSPTCPPAHLPATQIAIMLSYFGMGEELVNAAAILFTRAADLEKNVDLLTSSFVDSQNDRDLMALMDLLGWYSYVRYSNPTGGGGAQGRGGGEGAAACGVVSRVVWRREGERELHVSPVTEALLLLLPPAPLPPRPL